MFWLHARYLLLHWQLRPLLMWDEISVSLWSWESLHLFVQGLTGDVLLSSWEGSGVGRRKGEGAEPQIPEQMYYLMESNDNNVTNPKVYKSAWSSSQIDTWLTVSKRRPLQLTVCQLYIGFMGKDTSCSKIANYTAHNLSLSVIP